MPPDSSKAIPIAVPLKSCSCPLLALSEHATRRAVMSALGGKADVAMDTQMSANDPCIASPLRQITSLTRPSGRYPNARGNLHSCPYLNG